MTISKTIISLVHDRVHSYSPMESESDTEKWRPEGGSARSQSICTSLTPLAILAPTPRLGFAVRVTAVSVSEKIIKAEEEAYRLIVLLSVKTYYSRLLIA